MQPDPIKVLIIEDDPMVMEINAQFVGEVYGFQIVGKASTGSEGYQLIKTCKPHLILLDFFLPDTDGFYFLKKIREEQLPVDVILMTAARDVKHIQNVFRYGAVDYMIKPFRFDRLKSSLEAYRQRALRLEGLDTLDQQGLDEWKGKSAEKTIDTPIFEETSLPKGLNEYTLKQIFDFLLKQEIASSAEEVAQGTGLARVTVRRYLEYLATIGRVSLEIQYGSIGRPINRYKVLKWR